MSEKIPSIKIDSVSLAIWAIGSLLGKTWRCRTISSDFSHPNKESGFPRIFCFWHSNLLPITYAYRNTGKTAVVSESKDGRRAAAVASLWKTNIIFGSSSHGGFNAFRQCIKTLDLNKSVAITPDGPRGPKEIVKPGIAQIAILSKAPVITITASVKNAWYLKSWDRFMIPKPFTRINFIIGDPIRFTPNNDTEDSVEKLRLLIQQRLIDNAKLA